MLFSVSYFTLVLLIYHSNITEEKFVVTVEFEVSQNLGGIKIPQMPNTIRELEGNDYA